MFHRKSTILSFNRLLATMTISFLWSTIAVTRDSRRQSTSHLHTSFLLTDVGFILFLLPALVLSMFFSYLR